MQRTIKMIARMGTFVMALTVFLAMATTALATDRNRDGISDRWEKRHKLSLRVDQSGRDQDRDRVSNRCEFEAGTNPRRADSDRDGRRDGREDADRDGLSNAAETRLSHDCGDDDGDDDGVEDGDEITGRIVSFTDGVLVIDLVDGTDVSAPVAPDAIIECEDGDDDDDRRASVSHDDDDSSDDDSRDGDCDDSDNRSPNGSSSEEPRDGGSDSEDGSHCDVSALVAGALVHEAELRDGVFVKIKLLSGH